MQGPDSIPTALLNTRVSLRRFPSLGPVARLPVIHKRVSSAIPGIRPAFAWALSNHARTSPLGSPTSVSCYKSSQGYGLLCNTSTVMRRIFGMNVPTMQPLLVQRPSVESKHTHSLDTIPLRCLRHLTTLMTSYRYSAMPERRFCLLHNVWSKACDLCCTVSLCGFSLPLFLFSQSCDRRLFLGQSVQTHLYTCLPCLTTEVPDVSSTAACSSLLTSPYPDTMRQS